MANVWKWLNIGDLHLEKLDQHSELLGDWGVSIQLKVLRSQLRMAVEEGIRHVVVLGDVFDTPFPSQETIDALGRLLYEFRDLYWWVILGNHDVHSSEEHSLRVIDLLSHVGIKRMRVFTEPTAVKIRDIYVVFLPWPSPRPKMKMDGPHIVFSHVEYMGAMRDSGMVSTSGAKYSDRDDRYTISGHLHLRQIMGNIFYPGTSLPLTFGETKAKKSFAISTAVVNGDYLKVTHAETPVDLPFEFRSITVNHLGDFDKVPRQPDGNLYRIVIKNPSVLIPQNWLNERPHVIKRQGASSYDKDGVAKVNGKSMMANLPKMIRRQVKKNVSEEIRDDALVLLDKAFAAVGVSE